MSVIAQIVKNDGSPRDCSELRVWSGFLRARLKTEARYHFLSGVLRCPINRCEDVPGSR